jgi:hypothetical protein
MQKLHNNEEYCKSSIFLSPKKMVAKVGIPIERGIRGGGGVTYSPLLKTYKDY